MDKVLVRLELRKKPAEGSAVTMIQKMNFRSADFLTDSIMTLIVVILFITPQG